MNILLCLDLKGTKLSKVENYLTKLNKEEKNTVTFAYSFERMVYADNFLVTTYPSAADEKKLETEILTALKGLADSMKIDESIDTEYKVFFSHSAKEEVCNFANESKADEVLIVSKRKSGFENFFAGSFAEYFLRHCNKTLHIFRSLE